MRTWITAWVVVLGALLAGGATASAQDTEDHQVDSALERIGAFVERYYSRAQSVVADVKVRVQPMGRDLSSRGRSRRLLYEMRVEWPEVTDGASQKPIVIRDLLEADGRAPEPGDELECTDPRLVSDEPLAFFLPARQSDYSFTWAGRDREAGRDVIVLDYEARKDEPPTIEWTDSCVSVDVPGMVKGRVWADAEGGDVLRLDEHLTGMFEFPVPPEHSGISRSRTMILERADTSIRYRPVEFSDPDETLLLPSSIELMTVWRNTGTRRLFTTHEISNYRRFVTSSRLIRQR